MFNIIAFEEVLKTSKGKYCVGDQVTLADITLIPQLFFCDFAKIDLSPYPNILEIRAACEELPEFKATHPTAQPDFKPHP